MSWVADAAAGVASRSRRGALRAGVAIVVLLACLWLLTQRVEGPRLWAALRQADWRLVLAAALVNLTLNMAVRIERWRILLRRLPTTEATQADGLLRRLRLWRLYLSHLAANNLLPARAGEALRVVALSGPRGLKASGLVAVLLVEKGVETLSMGLVAALLLLCFSPPSALLGTLRWTLGLGAFCVVLAFVLTSLAGFGDRVQGRVRSFVNHLLDSLRLLHSPGLWGLALLCSLASLACDVGMIGLSLHAVGLARPIVDWLLLFFAINLAIALPTTPGQVGVLEAGAVFALSLLGVGASEALAFALLYHAAHVIPTTALGVLALLRLRASNADPTNPRGASA